MEIPAFQLPENDVSLAINATRKRKAEDALPGPRPPRRRSSPLMSESPTPTRSISSTSIQSPEPLSINYIIRGQGRSRLHVSPYHWTSQHLQLLDCRFLKEARQPNTKPGPKRRCLSSSACKDYQAKDKTIHSQRQNNEVASSSTELAICTVAGHLLRANIASFKTLAIRDFLEHYGIHQVPKQVPSPTLYT